MYAKKPPIWAAFYLRYPVIRISGYVLTYKWAKNQVALGR